MYVQEFIRFISSSLKNCYGSDLNYLEVRETFETSSNRAIIFYRTNHGDVVDKETSYFDTGFVNKGEKIETFLYGSGRFKIDWLAEDLERNGITPIIEQFNSREQRVILVEKEIDRLTELLEELTK